MSLEEFEQAIKILKERPRPRVLLMAFMRAADTPDQALARKAWPEVFDEVIRRTNSPEGKLDGDI